jgi:hypothetical protein
MGGADGGMTGWDGGWQAGTAGMAGWDGETEGLCRGREGGCLVTLVHSGLLKNGRATEW